MSSVTVNVVASTGTQTQSQAQAVSHKDDSIRAEARRRLLEQQAKERAETEARVLKEKREKEAAEARVREERVRLLAEEEQIRLRAQRMLIEAEAKRLADEREAAIAAEMERLRNRTPTEILEDKVNELTNVIRSLESQLSDQCRRCC